MQAWCRSRSPCSAPWPWSCSARCAKPSDQILPSRPGHAAQPPGSAAATKKETRTPATSAIEVTSGARADAAGDEQGQEEDEQGQEEDECQGRGDRILGGGDHRPREDVREDERDVVRSGSGRCPCWLASCPAGRDDPALPTGNDGAWAMAFRRRPMQSDVCVSIRSCAFPLCSASRGSPPQPPRRRRSRPARTSRHPPRSWRRGWMPRTR